MSKIINLMCCEIFQLITIQAMRPIKHSTIPIFIPELACPHRCVFCDQHRISGTDSVPEPDEISDIIEEYLATIPEDRRIDIAFFGGSFTGIPADLQKAYLKNAYKYIEDRKVSGIRISTRPDYITGDILSLLADYGVTAIELGAQSTNDEVLKKSGRGHTVSDIKKASEMIAAAGFELGLQMMIGLPGDTLERALATAKDIVDFGADTTRIYPALVIRGTALEKLYMEGRYKPLSLDDAIDWTKAIVKIFEEGDLTILRIGLHPSKDLMEGASLIAGPFAPSFREMVMTEIWNDILIEELKGRKAGGLCLEVNESQLNYAIGFKGKNKNRLNERGFNIVFKPDNKLEKYQINVSNN